jgi:FkbM family methyltransferase
MMPTDTSMKPTDAPIEPTRFPRALVVPITRRWKRGGYRIGEALGDRVLIGRTPGGSPIALSMRDHQHRDMYFYGAYEPDVTALFRRYVTPGSTVFDVGANAGYFAILSSELGAAVHAFEPNPAVRALLSLSAQLGRGDIEVVPCACSDHPGTMPLYLSDPGETGRSGLMVARDRSVDVEVITLDEYARRTDAHPQLVKIDVEGAEAGVIRGMSEILRTDRPTLIVELHVTKGEVEHATHDEVADLLEKDGYEHRPIDSKDSHGKVTLRSHIVATPRVGQPR